jgi:beta-glucanase (GH16 family)
MNKLLTLFSIIVLILMNAGCKKDEDNPASGDDGTTKDGWKLVWSDDFKNKGLPDSTKWTYQVGGSGWGNNELQYYTDRRIENTFVTDDVLVIKAIKENYNGNEYTSARLNTKASWKYGRFEIKARLPEGKGTWPAIWMMPTTSTYGGWPSSGEIDIMEHVGYDPNVIHASIHCDAYNHIKGTQKTSTVKMPDVLNTYHVYALEWNADSMFASIDGARYFTFKNEKAGWQKWPFDQEFYIILNIAVGGNWGGAQGVDPNIWPQQMEIDYVKVYQKVN